MGQDERLSSLARAGKSLHHFLPRTPASFSFILLSSTFFTGFFRFQPDFLPCLYRLVLFLTDVLVSRSMACLTTRKGTKSTKSFSTGHTKCEEVMCDD